MAAPTSGGSRDFNEIAAISAPTLAVLKAQGFTTATPVQYAVIPLFAGNKDVAVDACTGSGKTLAFLVPIVEKLRRLEEPLAKHQVGAIVVSPTRELAKQIHTVAQPFSASVPDTACQLLVGGSNPADDVQMLRTSGANVLIGTPGRLDDMLKRCSWLDCRRLEVLVLDEADRLLDMGFQRQLDAIMARLPKQRRTGLFSATQTEAVQALARAGLRNPVRVNVAVTAVPGAGQAAGGAEAGTQKTPSTLKLQYLELESQSAKLPQLAAFLQARTQEKVVVYFLTCACVEFYRTVLPRLPQLKGVPVKALYGKMKQAAREKTLQEFAGLQQGVLLCTDVAARGLDIPSVTWVIQFDPPQDPDAFVHRVGRTARMGRSGSSCVYLLPHEMAYVELLKRRKVPLLQGPVPEQPVDVLPAVQRLAETEREVMERGIKGFLSYMRGYKEHRCNYIFRLADLKLGPLATAFAVLRIPKVPEVRKARDLEGYTESRVDPNAVKYKDRAREKQRQKQLAVQQADGDKQQPQQQQRAAQQGLLPGKHVPAAKRRLLASRQERDDLDSDYRMLKKLKRGKITTAEFEEAIGIA